MYSEEHLISLHPQVIIVFHNVFVNACHIFTNSSDYVIIDRKSWHSLLASHCGRLSSSGGILPQQS